MNETYVECLIQRKTPTYMKFLKILTIMLTVCFFFIGIVPLVGIVPIVGIFIGLLFGLAAYFVWLNADVEYEYLYVDKELTIDKVMAKSKRKRVATFDLNKMEIVAPIKSWHLDNYKNRTDKTVDYSSGEEKQPDRRFVFFYDGQKKVIFEPNEEMVKAMQFAAPRKVYKD